MTIQELEAEQDATKIRQQNFCGRRPVNNEQSRCMSFFCEKGEHNDCIWQECKCECHDGEYMGVC